MSVARDSCSALYIIQSWSSVNLDGAANVQLNAAQFILHEAIFVNQEHCGSSSTEDPVIVEQVSADLIGVLCL
jgi:hypothetical protein